MDALSRLQAWYFAQCDGEWEHSYGIHIENCDNPGRLLRTTASSGGDPIGMGIVGLGPFVGDRACVKPRPRWREKSHLGGGMAEEWWSTIIHLSPSFTYVKL
jgi:hypothetical protein